MRTSMSRLQIADPARKLVAAGGRLAEPERDVGRRAFRVGDADDAGQHLADLPRRVAELEDVARHALDGEVLIHRPDERVVRLDDDAIVGDFWEWPRPT